MLPGSRTSWRRWRPDIESKRDCPNRSKMTNRGEDALAAIPKVLQEHINTAYPAHVCLIGTALPDGHPLVIRGKEAAGKIKDESGGRLDITFYTNSVLGQDTAMISQAIAGALPGVREGIRLEEGGDAAECGDIGASDEKPQELPARGADRCVGHVALPIGRDPTSARSSDPQILRFSEAGLH